MCAHVALKLHLQIDIDRTHRADDHIGTHAALDRYITTRIGKANVGGIIGFRHPYLSPSRRKHAIGVTRG